MAKFFSPETNELGQPQQNRIMPDRKTSRLIINAQSPEQQTENSLPKFKSPTKPAPDFRGVKSFTEYAERITKLQNATSSSHFYQGQQDFQSPG